MGYLKSFSKDTLYYGLGNAIKKFISFLLLPLYTRYLTPADYGILDSLATGILILSIIFGLNASDGGSRYYYEAESSEEKGKILFTVLVINLLSIFPALFLSFFANEISLILFKTDQNNWIVYAACLSIPLTLLNDEQSWIYRYKRKPWHFNIYISIRALANISLGILLVFYFKKGALGAQLATFLSLLITLLFSLLTFTHKVYTLKFSFAWAKKILLFSYPLMISGLIGWIYTSADRFLLLGYKSISDVGIYSIGATFARPIAILNMAIGMSFYPFFMSLYEKEKEVEKIKTKNVSNQIWNLYLFLALNICAFLSIFGREIIEIFATPVYIPAVIVIPLLIFSQIFRLSADVTSLGIFLRKRTIHYTWLVALTSVLSLLLNILFIPAFSYHGAALSNMLSNFAYLIVAYNLSQKYFFIKREIRIITIYMFIIFVISNLIPILEIQFDIRISIVAKILILSCCFFLPFILRFEIVKNVRSLFFSKALQ